MDCFRVEHCHAPTNLQKDPLLRRARAPLEQGWTVLVEEAYPSKGPVLPIALASVASVAAVAVATAVEAAA